MAEPKKTFIDRSTLVWLIAITVAIASLNQYINSRINSAINNTEFIQKIASHVRPYIIFNTKETILTDGGAMQYLHGPLKFIASDIGPELGASHYQIIVTPKDYLHLAPLIEMLCMCEFVITSERGKGLEWIYEMELVSMTEHWDDDEEPVHKFRLEIIR